ncbi:alpha-1,2-fucosyltransferase [Citrifermentans bremense]|uniref:alpha-1,2-fucosyltransferase n=1 Tax=Citrifermentans bremense TaxID=60035 RepID=UPI00047BD5DF|nr:alpha-1,2-fucosyltransferase [Citrifermentans bremense]
MIISNILGGLGNQMFQYAAGRGLSLAKSVELRLNTRDFTNYNLHNGFELDRLFNISAQTVTEEELRRFLGWRSSRMALRVLRHKQFSGIRGNRLIFEPSLSYWRQIMDAPEDCYLQGYWQTEKYFSHIAPIIRADFSFKERLSAQNLELAEKINLSNAVSLHVRRGDYAINPATLATHGLCSLDYYRQAINYITVQTEQPEFFIFSDDIPWVRKNLKIKFRCHYIEHNRGCESYNDMRLTSLCNHHIIANSSFSWWGAWLNPSAEKIVVAPKKWFVQEANISDLFPQGWVTL